MSLKKLVSKIVLSGSCNVTILGNTLLAKSPVKCDVRGNTLHVENGGGVSISTCNVDGVSIFGGTYGDINMGNIYVNGHRIDLGSNQDDSISEEDKGKKDWDLGNWDLKLSSLSVSGASSLVFGLDSAKHVNTNMTFNTSGTGHIELPPKTYDSVNCSSSGCSSVSFNTSTIKHLMIGTSGSSKVSGFIATGFANISASGCSNVNGNKSRSATINQDSSGCSRINLSWY